MPTGHNWHTHSAVLTCTVRTVLRRISNTGIVRNVTVLPDWHAANVCDATVNWRQNATRHDVSLHSRCWQAQCRGACRWPRAVPACGAEPRPGVCQRRETLWTRRHTAVHQRHETPSPPRPPAPHDTAPHPTLAPTPTWHHRALASADLQKAGRREERLVLSQPWTRACFPTSPPIGVCCSRGKTGYLRRSCAADRAGEGECVGGGATSCIDWATSASPPPRHPAPSAPAAGPPLAYLLWCWRRSMEWGRGDEGSRAESYWPKRSWDCWSDTAWRTAQRHTAAAPSPWGSAAAGRCAGPSASPRQPEAVLWVWPTSLRSQLAPAGHAGSSLSFVVPNRAALKRSPRAEPAETVVWRSWPACRRGGWRQWSRGAVGWCWRHEGGNGEGKAAGRAARPSGAWPAATGSPAYRPSCAGSSSSSLFASPPGTSGSLLLRRWTGPQCTWHSTLCRSPVGHGAGREKWHKQLRLIS